MSAETYNLVTTTLGDLGEAGLFLVAYRRSGRWAVVYSDQPLDVEITPNYDEGDLFELRTPTEHLWSMRAPSRMTHITHTVRTPSYKMALGDTFREALERVLRDA